MGQGVGRRTGGQAGVGDSHGIDIAVDDVDGEVAQTGEGAEVPSESIVRAGDGTASCGVVCAVCGGVVKGGNAGCGCFVVGDVNERDCMRCQLLRME